MWFSSRFSLVACLLACVLYKVKSLELYSATYVDLPEGKFFGFPSGGQVNNYLQALHYSNAEITAYGKVGLSYEKRPIMAFCLGRCGDDDDVHVAQTFFNAMHHSREPEAMMTMLLFLDKIFKTISVDPSERTTEYYQLIHLLNIRQLWFMPIVNPDGYQYNLDHPETKMQRKNRRPTCGGKDENSGVDLNRNYPICFDTPGDGSSVESCDEDYRGEEPFSEPETKTMFEFVHMHNFSTAINFHAYGKLIMFPYSCEQKNAQQAKNQTYIDETNYLRELALQLKGSSDYQVGRPFEKSLGLYSVNGDFADWLFTRIGTSAFSIEVGGGKFWPEQSEIATLAASNEHMMNYAAWAAGPLLSVESLEISDVCIEFQITNGGTWDSFGNKVTIRVGILTEGKISSVKEASVGKIEAKNSKSEVVKVCFDESGVQFGSSFSLQIADRGHCVVYKFGSEKKSIQFNFGDAVRLDPGVESCSLFEPLEEPYLDRPTMEELRSEPKPPTPKKRHVPKIWEKDYNKTKTLTNDGVSVVPSQESGKYTDIKEKIEGLAGEVYDILKSWIFLIGAVVGLTFVVTFMVTLTYIQYKSKNDKKNRGKYAEVEMKEGFTPRLSSIQEDFDSDIETDSSL